jgi:hypothetical protein
VTETLGQADGASSDAALIAAVRRGDTNAYGVLYQRHLRAAKRAAACLAATASEREDLVAEAFTRVLRALRSGRGPSDCCPRRRRPSRRPPPSRSRRCARR